MAQFLGTVNGQKGEASRLGSKASGLTTEACSWQGKIVVSLSHDEATGKDHYVIRMAPHHGRGISVLLAKGVVGDAYFSAVDD